MRQNPKFYNNSDVPENMIEETNKIATQLIEVLKKQENVKDSRAALNAALRTLCILIALLKDEVDPILLAETCAKAIPLEVKNLLEEKQ